MQMNAWGRVSRAPGETEKVPVPFVNRDRGYRLHISHIQNVSMTMVLQFVCVCVFFFCLKFRTMTPRALQKRKKSSSLGKVQGGFMRVIHARPSPLPVFFSFFFFFSFVSVCSSVLKYILLCLCPFFHCFFFLFCGCRMKNSNRQIRWLHTYVSNKSTPCKPT